jgi:hypothetical protein
MTSPGMLALSERHRSLAASERQEAYVGFTDYVAHEAVALAHERIARYLETWAGAGHSAASPAALDARRPAVSH